MKKLTKKDICEIVYDKFLSSTEILEEEKEVLKLKTELAKSLAPKQAEQLEKLLELLVIARNEREQRLTEFVVDFYRAFHR